MNETEKAVSEVLLKAEAINREQLDSAIRFKNQNGMSLEDALVRLRYAGEAQVAQALSKVSGMPFASKGNNMLRPEDDAELRRMVDKVFAVDNLVLPLYVEEGTLHAAMAAPQGGVLGLALALKTGMPVSCFIAPASELTEAIGEFYR
ncbi:MAG: hypothetical protein HY928_12535 [Elusimicrobia bacterium]|nr:hypothetical protein [Elusimicrobiota bacterium]